MQFQEFTKIARLSREMTITEKIDGTNAQVFIFDLNEIPFGDFSLEGWKSFEIAYKDNLVMLAGSRNRYITPEKDNFGFAKWVKENADELFTLGPGTHYGEWWGSGIQRNYGQTEKHWSLFNTKKWLEDFDNEKTLCPKCCRVVPVLYRGPFDTESTNGIMGTLKLHGSFAAPFMNPEGIVIYHSAAGIYFKKTFEHDEKGKGEK
jgi:hypothetical protein